MSEAPHDAAIGPPTGDPTPSPLGPGPQLHWPDDSASVDRAAQRPGNLLTDSPDGAGWAGWVTFAGVTLALLGLFQAIEGLAALLNADYYQVAARALPVNVNYTAWGWVHLLLGALAVVTGFGLALGNPVARVAGIGIAGLSAVVNLAFAPAYPVWAVLIITFDVVTIYAIAVHGGELRRAR